MFVQGKARQLRSPLRSQSLFHQVCVRSQVGRLIFSDGGSRNPFFIRSVFVLLCQKFSQPTRRRNPFFIRSVFVHALVDYLVQEGIVSQSLFHQVCVRSRKDLRQHFRRKGRNPFFIRSVFVPLSPPVTSLSRTVSQSLFHQVCVRSP